MAKLQPVTLTRDRFTDFYIFSTGMGKLLPSTGHANRITMIANICSKLERSVQSWK